jgi:heterotetrameric sarcosine oxidase delta subunit
MILVPCPHCGPRNASEFRCVGEQRARPPDGTGPEQWRSYLYLRTNADGWVTESWYHRAGCRQYFIVERDTVTNEVRPLSAQPQPASGVDVVGAAADPAGDEGGTV